MTMVDPLALVNEFLREKHPEWLDYPAELRRDLRTKGRQQSFTVIENFSPENLAHWLHDMEQRYQDHRIKSVYFDGSVVINFSAQPALN